MTAVSDKYLSVLDKHLMSGVPLEDMNMTEAQKLRSRIVFDAYHLWTYDKMINPLDLVRRVAKRMYSQMLDRAKFDDKAQHLCQVLNIRDGYSRSPSELSNDVAALNHIIGHFNAPTTNIERAKVVAASDWLLNEGM